jgi:hypothetical protein
MFMAPEKFGSLKVVKDLQDFNAASQDQKSQ